MWLLERTMCPALIQSLVHYSWSLGLNAFVDVTSGPVDWGVPIFGVSFAEDVVAVATLKSYEDIIVAAGALAVVMASP